MKNEDADFEVFDEGDKILVQKDIEIKDLEAKNKALEERNTKLINTNNELNEALSKLSFVPAGKYDELDGGEDLNPLPSFDIHFEKITIRDFRLKLGEIALQDNGPFEIFMRKVE